MTLPIRAFSFTFTEVDSRANDHRAQVLTKGSNLMTKKSDLEVHGSVYRLPLGRSIKAWWHLKRPERQQIIAIVSMSVMLLGQFLIREKGSTDFRIVAVVATIGVVFALGYSYFDRGGFDCFGSRGGLAVTVHRWSSQFPNRSERKSNVLFEKSQWMEFDKNGRMIESGTYVQVGLGVSPIFRRLRELEVDGVKWNVRKVRR